MKGDPATEGLSYGSISDNHSSMTTVRSLINRSMKAVLANFTTVERDFHLLSSFPLIDVKSVPTHHSTTGCVTSTATTNQSTTTRGIFHRKWCTFTFPGSQYAAPGRNLVRCGVIAAAR
ncbi:hypothetical protein J6590_012041 [Homalodisca vitripennis]|nr:hypothetical protein J6590_012041 [Homalodisca vitripennis]